MRRIACLMLLLVVSACSHWPDYGAGGVAEFAPPPAAPAIPDQAVASHLDCSLGNVAVLANASSLTGRGTGQVVELDLVAARAQREVAGSLPKDAGRTLIFLDNQVAALAPALLVGGTNTKQCTG